MRLWHTQMAVQKSITWWPARAGQTLRASAEPPALGATPCCWWEAAPSTPDASLSSMSAVAPAAAATAQSGEMHSCIVSVPKRVQSAFTPTRTGSQTNQVGGHWMHAALLDVQRSAGGQGTVVGQGRAAHREAAHGCSLAGRGGGTAPESVPHTARQRGRHHPQIRSHHHTMMAL